MENVKVEEGVVVANEKYRIFVIENRVRLYKGKDIVYFEECGSYEAALKVANELNSKYENCSYSVTAPNISDQKRRSIEAAAKRASMKRSLKEIKKTKENITKEMEELQKKLALLGE